MLGLFHAVVSKLIFLQILLKIYEREFPLLYLPFCFVWYNKVKSYLYHYYNFQLCDLEILVTAPEKCEVRGPEPQTPGLFFILL